MVFTRPMIGFQKEIMNNTFKDVYQNLPNAFSHIISKFHSQSQFSDLQKCLCLNIFWRTFLKKFLVFINQCIFFTFSYILVMPEI